VENKDFTDYAMLFFNTGRIKEFKAAFNELIKNANLIQDDFPELFKEEPITQEAEDYKEVNFYEITDEKHIGEYISFNAICRGESEKPYVYPLKVKASCNLNKGKDCEGCGLFFTGGNVEVDLNNLNPLEIVGLNDNQKKTILKRKVGIMSCNAFDIEYISQKYLQELFLSPVVQDVTNMINPEENKEQRFIIRHAFCEGSEVVPNKPYKFYGMPTSFPKNQSSVFYLKKHEIQEDNLDNFQLSKEDIEKLRIFQVDDDYESIDLKLKHIYRDFSTNLSPIILHREDLMFACDLVFHSVLHFNFGKSWERGYTECLIVGDTQVGKTKIAQKLIHHYKLGVIQGSANATIAGIIGGQERHEGVSIMTWGLLPLNHSRLVALDEISDLDPKIIKEMTRIRSEGVAERTIIGGPSMTQSKVRLIWISNPKKVSTSQYDNGVEVIRELIGKDEDISRFDFAIIASSDEVTTEMINTKRLLGGSGTRHVYESEACNKLISWVWSRKSNNVIFEKGVEELILFFSIEMAKKYTPIFPLVVGSTIRLKLTKLTIALAARLFSTDETGLNIVVKENHANYIYEFLNRIYDKNNFRYGEYSRLYQEGQVRSSNSKADFVVSLHKICPDVRNFCINMLSTNKITAIEVRDFLRCDKERADTFRMRMVSDGFLIKREGFYIKSELLRKVLQEELDETT
jgi:GTPase SAR1 family protein